MEIYLKSLGIVVDNTVSAEEGVQVETLKPTPPLLGGLVLGHGGQGK